MAPKKKVGEGKLGVAKKVGDRPRKKEAGEGSNVASRKRKNVEAEGEESGSEEDVGVKRAASGSEEAAGEKRPAGPITRCAPQYFDKMMDGLELRITSDQREAMLRTPFAHFRGCSKCSSSVVWLEALTQRYQATERVFMFNEGVKLKWDKEQFSCVLGLQHIGKRRLRNQILLLLNQHPSSRKKSKRWQRILK